jgi:hypothetical protein
MDVTEQVQKQSGPDNVWLTGLRTAGGGLSALAGLLGGLALVLDKTFGILDQLTKANGWVDLGLAIAGIIGVVHYLRIVRRLKRLPAPQIAAFIGPASFTQDDRDRFFGRESEIDDLCRKLADPDTVVCTVFGQSGCGKTSLVRAGIIPEVSRRFGFKGVYLRLYNRPQQSVRMVLNDLGIVWNPGHEFQYKASSTSEATPQSAEPQSTPKMLVFFIDQFEEFFLSGISEEDHSYFMTFTKELIEARQTFPSKMVFLIRSDFLYRMTELEVLTKEDILSRSNRHPLAVFDKNRAEIVIRESLRSSVKEKDILPWTDGLIESVIDDLLLEKMEIDVGDVRTFILPAELQIVCQVVQQRGWTRADQYSNKVKLIRDYVREAVESSPQPSIAEAILVALIHDNGITRANPQTPKEVSSRLEKVTLSDAVRQLEYLDRQRRLVNQVVRTTDGEIEVAYELAHEYLVTVLRPLYSQYLDKVEKANTLLHQSRKNQKYDPTFRLNFSQSWLIRRYATELLTVDDRRLIRQAEIRAAVSVGLAVAIPTILILAIRYGTERLILIQVNSQETLSVQPGINYLKPILGSDDVALDFGWSYSLASTAGSVFQRNGSLLFPTFRRDRLFSWVNTYYQDRLKEADHAESLAADLFVEQLDVNNPTGDELLVKSLSSNAPAAHALVRVHHLAEEKYKAVLLSNLQKPDPETVADSLNTLRELYGDSTELRERTKLALSQCTENVAKLAIALSYTPELESLTRCANKMIDTNHWDQVAALVVRFRLSDGDLLTRVRNALGSTEQSAFRAAAFCAGAGMIKGPAIVSALKGKLTDKNKAVKESAALTLWSLNDDSDSVRSIVREMVSSAHFMGDSYLEMALAQSVLTDEAIDRALENQVFSISTSSSRSKPLTVVELINKFVSEKPRILKDLHTQCEQPKGDFAVLLCPIRLAALGDSNKTVLDALDQDIRSGAPGTMGFVLNPEVAEYYATGFLSNATENFDQGLVRLWTLLQSQRAESSANYRLAVEYAITKLVLSGKTKSDIQSRWTEVMKSMSSWAHDRAPHHRAAYVHTWRMINEQIERDEHMLDDVHL